MMRRIIALSLASCLAGCATLQNAGLPVCDGKTRRPANPHGSVLAPTAGERPPAPSPSAALPPPSQVGACR